MNRIPSADHILNNFVFLPRFGFSLFYPFINTKLLFLPFFLPRTRNKITSIQSCSSHALAYLELVPPSALNKTLSKQILQPLPFARFNQLLHYRRSHRLILPTSILLRALLAITTMWRGGHADNQRGTEKS